MRAIEVKDLVSYVEVFASAGERSSAMSYAVASKSKIEIHYQEVSTVELISRKNIPSSSLTFCTHDGNWQTKFRPRLSCKDYSIS